jgi:ABC-2 type transport system permease protein
MNRVLISLTVRQLLGRRRTLAVGLVLALPVVIAAAYRLSGGPEAGESSAQFAFELVNQLILTLLLPLVALVLGTAALGAEIEDGTAVFLLTKPVERWRIIVIKIGVAAAATLLLVVPSTMLAVWIANGSATDDGLMLGLGLGAAAASLLYCAVFVALSAVTGRALVIGLVFVFVWEGIVTNLFDALRWLSIREYAIGWSDAFISIADREIYDPRLALVPAVVVSVVVGIAAAAYGARALARFEIGERS